MDTALQAPEATRRQRALVGRAGEQDLGCVTWQAVLWMQMKLSSPVGYGQKLPSAAVQAL